MTEQGSLGTLGSIEQVDLKELWPNHEADFTPWLVEDISRLGDVLGMQLVVRGHDLPGKGQFPRYPGSGRDKQPNGGHRDTVRVH